MPKVFKYYKGTTEGGAKAAKAIREKYGEDYYKKIGAVGGSRSSNGGFASDKVGKDGLTGKQRAKIMGAKGGSISRRGQKAVKNIFGKVKYISKEEYEERQKRID